MEVTSSQNELPKRSPREIAELCSQSDDLVKRVLSSFRKSGISFESDELLAWGREGLLDAARRFDPSKGDDFRKYAYFRVRGAMIDGMRKMGPWSRRGYERVSMLRALSDTSAAHSEDVRDIDGIDSAEAALRLRTHMASVVTAMTMGVYAAPVVQGDGIVTAVDSGVSVEEQLGDRQLADLVRSAIVELPPPEDEVIRRYYVDGERMDVIARELGCSKSWISRVHSRALKRLGSRLRAMR